MAQVLLKIWLGLAFSLIAQERKGSASFCKLRLTLKKNHKDSSFRAYKLCTPKL